MSYGKNSMNQENKKVVRKRKKERKKFINDGYNDCRWFGGILHFIDRDGRPKGENTEAEVIPKAGKRVTGLTNSYCTYWEEKKRLNKK